MKDIYFLGDCFFKSLNDQNPFSIINTELMNNFAVCNLETSIYENYEKNVDKFVQLGIQIDEIPEGSIDYIDVFNLANNHTFDFGEKGLQSTIKFLTEREKKLIGIQDFAYYITEINGKTIGFVGCIAYSGIRRERYINAKRAISITKKIKNKCDSIILYVHWGTEYADYPSPFQRKLSRKFINAGADLIVGHHTHVFQGYEVFDGKYIYYSLGNCNFYINKNWLSKWIEISLILKVKGCNTDSIENLFYKIDKNYCLAELADETTKNVNNHFCSISNKKLEMNWLKWGMKVSPIFIKQEKNAFKQRFARKGLKQYLIFLYWLTRPKTLFLLLTYFLVLIKQHKSNAIYL